MFQILDLLLFEIILSLATGAMIVLWLKLRFPIFGVVPNVIDR
jgi:hypothetical protein